MAQPDPLAQEQQILAQKSHEAYLLADRLGVRVKEAHLMAGRQLNSAAQFQQMADAASRHIQRTTESQFKKSQSNGPRRSRRDRPHADMLARDRKLLQLPTVASAGAQETSQNAASAQAAFDRNVVSGSQFDDQADVSLVSNDALRTPMFLVGRHTRPWQYPDESMSQRPGGRVGADTVDSSKRENSLQAISQQQMKSEEVGFTRPQSRSSAGSADRRQVSHSDAASEGSLPTSAIHVGKRTTLLQRHELAQLKALGPLSCPLSPVEQRLSRTERVDVLYARLMASTREHVGRFAEAVRWQAPSSVMDAIAQPGKINSIHQVNPGPAVATSGKPPLAEGGGDGGGQVTSTPVHLPTATILQFVLERIELGAAHVPVRLRYSRRQFGTRFMTQGVAFLVEALTWLVHSMTWRAHGSSHEQEVLLTVIAFLYKQLMTHVTGMGRDSFFRFLLPAAAEAAWCAIWFAIPGSRGHYDAALKLRVYLIIMRVVAGMELSPMAVQSIMIEAFPDTMPDAPVNVSLMLNSAVLGDSSAALGNVVEIGDALAKSRASGISSSSSPPPGGASDARTAADGESKAARQDSSAFSGGGGGSLGADLAIDDALQASSLLDSVHLTPAQRASLGDEGAYLYQTLRSLPEHAFVPHTAYVAAFEYAYQYLVENKIMTMIEAAGLAGEGEGGGADDADDGEGDSDWRVQSRKRAAAHQLAMQLIKQRVKYRDISVKLPVRSTSTNLQRVLPGKRIVGGRQYQMKYSTLTPWSETGGVDTFAPVLQRLLKEGALGQQLLSFELPSALPRPQPRADDAAAERASKEARQAARQVQGGTVRRGGDATKQVSPGLNTSDSTPGLLQATTRTGADKVHGGIRAGMRASKSAASLGISARISASGLTQRASDISTAAAKGVASAARETRGVVRQLKSPYENVHGVSAAARVIQSRHMGVHPARRRAQAQRAALSKSGHSDALGVATPLVGTDGELHATRHVDSRTGALVSVGGVSVAAAAARKAAVAMFGDSDGDGVPDDSGLARATAVSDGQGLTMRDSVPAEPAATHGSTGRNSAASRALHKSVQDEIAAAAAVSASLASTLQRASQRALVQDSAGASSAVLGDQGHTVDRSGMKAVSMGPLANSDELLAANFSPLNPQRQSSQFRHVRMALPRPSPLMRLHRAPGGEASAAAHAGNAKDTVASAAPSSPALPPVGRKNRSAPPPSSPLRGGSPSKPSRQFAQSKQKTHKNPKAQVAVIDGQLVQVVQADAAGAAAADVERSRLLRAALSSTHQVDALLNKAGDTRRS